MAAHQDVSAIEPAVLETRQYRHLTVIRTQGRSVPVRLIPRTFWAGALVLLLGFGAWGWWFPVHPGSGAGPMPRFPAMSRGIQLPGTR